MWIVEVGSKGVGRKVSVQFFVESGLVPSWSLPSCFISVPSSVDTRALPLFSPGSPSAIMQSPRILIESPSDDNNAQILPFVARARDGHCGERDRDRDREQELHGHIDRDRELEKESGTRRDETIGAETTVAVVRALTGSTRNADGTTIDAASSGVMLSVVTVEGVRSCLCRDFSESRYALIPFLSALK